MRDFYPLQVHVSDVVQMVWTGLFSMIQGCKYTLSGELAYDVHAHDSIYAGPENVRIDLSTTCVYLWNMILCGHDGFLVAHINKREMIYSNVAREDATMLLHEIEIARPYIDSYN